ncbi:MAG: sigma-70 family RNA polymerase sigma factor [Bacteroidales bacterium]|nr:sigma-70 family RNA polymerase sigma factor [Bacteroidales bacterium]
MDLKEFKASFFPLRDQLFRFANRYLHHEEEAADLVQDTFLKLWNKRATLDQVRNPETFAMTMVKNASIDQLRKRKVVRMEELKTDPTSNSNPHDRLEQSESYSLVRKAMDELPEQQQTLIQLRDIEGYEYEEIAEITGLTINTIRVNISRARGTIKSKLIKQEENELVQH